MLNIENIATYIFLFTSLYFEVFILLTYLENRKTIKSENQMILQKIKRYPTVSIIVPSWNEEKTISNTIHSLLNLNYPKDKFEILAIDDGSTDRTFDVLNKFNKFKNVRVFQKTNGGKHTALNFGLNQSTSELVGCLDADSYVDRNALRNIVLYFENDKTAMAVTPSVKIYKPKNALQMVQKVEYGWGVFLRKSLSYLGALYVTPGPFSIFKREVFEKIGNYRKAHNTEDMEMAMRMQTNKMRIVNSHNSVIYTVAPDTLRKLFRQRVRWTYGFIKNSLDYKFIFFRMEYGNLGIFVLPMAAISIISAIYILGNLIFSIINKIMIQVVKIQTIGLHINLPNFKSILSLDINWFSINTEFVALASIATLVGTLAMLYLSRKMSEGKFRIGMDLIYFMTLYTLIAPIWLTRALFRAIIGTNPSWR